MLLEPAPLAHAVHYCPSMPAHLIRRLPWRSKDLGIEYYCAKHLSPSNSPGSASAARGWLRAKD